MNTLSQLILGQEKAAVAGATSGILALLAQVGVNGNLTLKDTITAVLVWLVSHTAVYLTKNKNLPESTKDEGTTTTPQP
jgi:hypothetical protein